ncbi:phage protein NinX family protein [Klebsiella michiganensis]|uniref:phage protein NinX family protein n=1 Tax=Klebsiella michiganensis TaxID=1134687 RepID=UPI0034D305D2
MDYSKLSDKEINKKVAFALGCKEVVPDIFMDDNRRYEFDKPKNKSGNKFYFDPCNNITDAWPIILRSRISMVWDCAEYASAEWWNAFDPFDDCRIEYQSNPLRAAMTVFLMMHEGRQPPS